MDFFVEETLKDISIKSTVYRSKSHFEDWLDSFKSPVDFNCSECGQSKITLNRPIKDFWIRELDRILDKETLISNGGYDELIKEKGNYSFPHSFSIVTCKQCDSSYLIIFGQHEQWASCNVTKLKVIFKIDIK